MIGILRGVGYQTDPELTVVISSTEPTSPEQGTVWIETSDTLTSKTVRMADTAETIDIEKYADSVMLYRVDNTATANPSVEFKLFEWSNTLKVFDDIACNVITDSSNNQLVYSIYIYDIILETFVTVPTITI